MTTPAEEYQANILRYTKTLQRIKKRRNWVTLAKLLVFCLLAGVVYLLVSGTPLSVLWIGAGLVALFIVLTIADTKIVIRQQQTEILIAINRTEADYLQGNLSQLPAGQEFQNPAHAYSNDLDVFGDDSLFQHLNRTVTAGGAQKLAAWLLRPCKDADTIRERQQAAGELAARQEWCQQFRALGILYKTGVPDQKNISQWKAEPPYFKNRRKAGTLIYAGNAVVAAGWLAAIAGAIPYSAGLLLSLVQLVVTALHLKRINKQHRQPELFIKSIGNYFHLVEWLHAQAFQSRGMAAIKEQLFRPESNSLQAFASLNRILNGFDQRSNVLLAFVLNGLYMKDFHFIMRLDQWKAQYGKEIEKWTELVSETDVLISMGAYRFNHPAYAVPEISASLLLDARGAGHPLMKGAVNVTNDFKIESLHNLYIVTGANMAGKSTFLRTVGVNLVLAQSGNVVCSDSFAFQPTALFTSMRTTDNLAKGTSYFHAELLRLKELVDHAAQEERLFIILDEMLKGTNSLDKLNGSTAFLRKLLTLPVAGLVATHDLALGELAAIYPEHFFNVCFEITHTDTGISYDYKLHPGISRNMNASILLQQMGLI